MAVGFWNFAGAVVFGFLINTPIVSYYEIGTILTLNHGRAAFIGVFGMQGVELMAYVLRKVTTEGLWPRVEKLLNIGFWGLNIGLAMMIVLSPLAVLAENSGWRHFVLVEACQPTIIACDPQHRLRRARADGRGSGAEARI